MYQTKGGVNLSKKHKTNGGKAPMEFPSRRGKNNTHETEEVVCRETLNSNHQIEGKTGNITEVITAEADLKN